jgi:hypothetical protein
MASVTGSTYSFQCHGYVVNLAGQSRLKELENRI